MNRSWLAVLCLVVGYVEDAGAVQGLWPWSHSQSNSGGPGGGRPGFAAGGGQNDFMKNALGNGNDNAGGQSSGMDGSGQNGMGNSDNNAGQSDSMSNDNGMNNAQNSQGGMNNGGQNSPNNGAQSSPNNGGNQDDQAQNMNGGQAQSMNGGEAQNMNGGQAQDMNGGQAQSDGGNGGNGQNGPGAGNFAASGGNSNGNDNFNGNGPAAGGAGMINNNGQGPANNGNENNGQNPGGGNNGPGQQDGAMNGANGMNNFVNGPTSAPDPDAVKRVNLCSDGKLLPEVYVIGAPRTGSSTLAYDLVKGGIRVASDMSEEEVRKSVDSGNFAASGAKEWHFFDRWVMWGHGEGQDGERNAWLDKLPQCPGQRSVLADFTPAYLRMVPMPPGALPAPDVLHRKNVEARGFRPGSTGLLRIPQTLKDMYGPVLSSQVTFITLLRNPLERMQSHWYIDRHLPEPATFDDAIKDVMTGLEHNPPLYNEFVWASLYSWGFRHWLQEFPARQFVVILSKDYFKQKMQACQYLSARLEFNLACQQQQADTHLNSAEHPGVDQDLSPDTRNKVRDLIQTEKQQLAEVLADAMPDGIFLLDYQGKFATPAGVEAWLENGW